MLTEILGIATPVITLGTGVMIGMMSRSQSRERAAHQQERAVWIEKRIEMEYKIVEQEDYLQIVMEGLYGTVVSDDGKLIPYRKTESA
jgi:hypothetical protein